MPNTSMSRLWGTILAAGLVLPLAVVAAPPAQAADRTSTTEARRVDRIKTPKIAWVEDEERGGYAAKVKVPLDYDKPTGAKVTIALFKVPAADPAAKLGTLFVNPGGPGGSGVAMAADATAFLSQTVLDHFDVVGFDPRGTNLSTEVTCFANGDRQSAALSGFGDGFPGGSDQTSAFIAASQKLGSACSVHGKTLASAMSTAEVARDMDVLRRAVGDKRLNYLGFSYGSYLGEVYANLFPDRFRAMVIDGVINPIAWAGTKLTNSVPATIRGKSGEASWNALVEGLAACKAAGPDYCPLADPQGDFDAVAASLKATPVTIGEGVSAYSYSYTDLISDTHSLLTYPEGMDYVAQVVAALKQAIDDQGASTGMRAGSRAATLLRDFHRASASLDAGYDNTLEAFSAVLCTDAYEPASPSTWIQATSKAQVRAPHFGPYWGWSDVQCATNSWKARDEDAYHGSYSRSTAAPVLIVGNYHDPATNYVGAVEANTLMPNSVLLRSDSWGHTAYGTSDCVTDRVDAYLVDGKVPADTAQTVCTGDVQPFTMPLGGSAARGKSSNTLQVPTREGLPPVQLPWPRRQS